MPVLAWGTCFKSTMVLKQEPPGVLKEESWLCSTQSLSTFVEQTECSGVIYTTFPIGWCSPPSSLVCLSSEKHWESDSPNRLEITWDPWVHPLTYHWQVYHQSTYPLGCKIGILNLFLHYLVQETKVLREHYNKFSQKLCLCFSEVNLFCCNEVDCALNSKYKILVYSSTLENTVVNHPETSLDWLRCTNET